MTAMRTSSQSMSVMISTIPFRLWIYANIKKVRSKALGRLRCWANVITIVFFFIRYLSTMSNEKQEMLDTWMEINRCKRIRARRWPKDQRNKKIAEPNIKDGFEYFLSAQLKTEPALNYAMDIEHFRERCQLKFSLLPTEDRRAYCLLGGMGYGSRWKAGRFFTTLKSIFPDSLHFKSV